MTTDLARVYIADMSKTFVCAIACVGLAACSSDSAIDSVDAAVTIDAAIDASAATGTLSGSVSRTASPGSAGDARGPVYIALFDRDPISNMSSAVVVSRVRIENVDLSGGGATIAYSLTDIPPRATDYFIVAFLDDNANVDPMSTSAGPDKGDLVSLDGFASPKVKVTAPEVKTHNLVLNSVLPF